MSWAWDNRPQLRTWWVCTCSHPDCGQVFRQLAELPPTRCFAWVHWHYNPTPAEPELPKWVEAALLDGTIPMDDLPIKRAPAGPRGPGDPKPTRCNHPVLPEQCEQQLADPQQEFVGWMRRLRNATDHLVWDGVSTRNMLRLSAEALRQKGEGCPECAELAEALDGLVDQPLVLES